MDRQRDDNGEVMKKTAVFAGSFDPVTVGHLDLIKRASHMFDEVIVAVLVNASKTPAFTMDERLSLLDALLDAEHIGNVSCKAFSGLTVDFCHDNGARFLVRGIRSGADLEYERGIEDVNRRLSPDIETVYLAARPELASVSSSVVREVGRLGGSIKGLVPEPVYKSIAERLTKR